MTQLYPYGAPGKSRTFSAKVTQTFLEKTASDTLIAGISETPNDPIETDTTDKITVTLTEVAGRTVVPLPRSDTLTVTFTETSSIQKSGTLDVARTDALTVGWLETANMAVVLSDTDTLTTGITDASVREIAFTLQAITASDTLTPVVADVWSLESYTPFEAKDAVDTLQVGLTESLSLARSQDVDRIAIVVRPKTRITLNYV